MGFVPPKQLGGHEYNYTCYTVTLVWIHCTMVASSHYGDQYKYMYLRTALLKLYNPVSHLLVLWSTLVLDNATEM